MTSSSNRRLAVVSIIAIALLAFTFLIPGQASLAQTPPLRLGIMGDSTIDEYRGTDNRGGAFGSVTFNWMEQMVRSRNITAGQWATWAEPRRTGYEYNWARSAATSQDLLSSGQHTGLASQNAQGKIDLVIIGVGDHDFAPYNPTGYGPIYDGTYSDAQVTAKVNGVIANYTTAVDTVLNARHIPMIATLITDFSLSPIVLNDNKFADPVKRQRVSNAIAQANAGIVAMANARGMKVFDPNAYGLSLSAAAPGGILNVGGVSLNLMSSGDDPHNGILGDHIHIGTIMEGLFANQYLILINQLTNANIPLFSNQEILTTAGLAAPSNQPPQANNDSLSDTQNTAASITYSVMLANDSDPNGDPLSVSGYSQAAHGSVTAVTNGLTYTPSAGYTGADSFPYQVSDGHGGTGVANVMVTISAAPPTNHAPVANNDSYTTSEDTTLNVAASGVLTNDTDADSNPLTAALTTSPTKGTLTFNSNGSFTYVPNANVNGSDSFTYRVNDGSLNSNTATVSITITAVNDAPVAHNDAFSTQRNHALTISLTTLVSNDTDVDGDLLQVTTSTLPSHGTMVPSSATTVIYTPTANWTGTDSVVYTISDGHGGTSSATVTITVTP